MREEYQIKELERQIQELWQLANQTTNTKHFQEIMNKIGEKRKKIMMLKGE